MKTDCFFHQGFTHEVCEGLTQRKIMKTDCFFHQGFTHEVCEDYAMNGPDYVVLSDGCSNAGGKSIMSDWGSRMMCLAAQGLRHLPGPLFEMHLGNQLEHQLANLYFLPSECISATLILLMSDKDRIQVRFCGDGVIGGKKKDGNWEIWHIDYVPGGTENKAAPYYLRYTMRDETKRWKKLYGGRIRLRHYVGDLTSPAMSYQSGYELRTQRWQEFLILSEQSRELQIPEESILEFEFPVSDYEFVFGCSDGVDSFVETVESGTSKTTERVHVLDVLRVLLDFQSFPPGFAKLQRNWCFVQDRAGTFIRRKWRNLDDVSVGVIYCEE